MSNPERPAVCACSPASEKLLEEIKRRLPNAAVSIENCERCAARIIASSSSLQLRPAAKLMCHDCAQQWTKEQKGDVEVRMTPEQLKEAADFFNPRAARAAWN